MPIAPFSISIVPLGYHRNPQVREAAEKLYAQLSASGTDVLLEDRDARPGVLFADMDLLGVPHRLVLSERGLAAGTIEYKGRRDAEPRILPAPSLEAFLREQLTAR
jgi:prolyl-tRNA synthetase